MSEPACHIMLSFASFKISKVVVISWIVMLVLVVASIIVTKKLKDNPGPLQNLAELFVVRVQKIVRAFKRSKKLRLGCIITVAVIVLVIVAGRLGLWTEISKLVALVSSEEGAEEATSGVLFSIGGFEVTSAVTTSWAIMLIAVVFSILATRKMKDVPGPLQNIAEMAVEKLQSFFGGIMGEQKVRRYFPVLATYFIFIVISNYSGILPGVGKLTGFASPTANLSVTAGLSLVAFFAIHGFGIKKSGGRYFKSFLKPFAALLPLTLIEQLVRPFSLALRLYGNMYGEEQVGEQLKKIFPLILPLLIKVLSLLFCLIQAMVFTMLFAVFLEEATEEEERLPQHA